jgi:hypothetical protein
MISNYSRTTTQTDNIYLITESANQILAGMEQNFNYLVTIPPNILNYTAIGKIAARYYVLYLDASLGCCTNNATACIHLILHSRTPVIIERRDLDIPHNWTPKMFQKVTCQNMPPFQNLSE